MHVNTCQLKDYQYGCTDKNWEVIGTQLNRIYKVQDHYVSIIIAKKHKL